MRLVIDSSVAIRASRSSVAQVLLSRHALVAPPLLWSEVYSGLSQARYRGELTFSQVEVMLNRFEELGVEPRMPDALYSTSFSLARALGWAKTYDAEFLALAQLEGVKVLTLDHRFRRGAERTGLVIGPSDL